MKLQEYLRKGGSIPALTVDYGISVTPHPELPLMLFKYSQFLSPFAEQIVQESRGVILEAATWNVVARAFDKFFNYGEGHAAEIDWSSAYVQEKLDGSLCVLYFYADKWRVATSGSPNAGGSVHTHTQTFAEYFWETFKEEGLDLPRDTAICYYFEITGPNNRVVIPHSDAHLTLLGARHTGTQQELFLGEAVRHIPGVRTPSTFPLTSIEDVVKASQTLKPLQQEGYVVCDAQFRRLKIKSPGYVALHHAKDGLTEKAFIDIARSGEVPEVLTAFPEFAPQLAKVQADLAGLIGRIEVDFDNAKGADTQKDFALLVKARLYSAALFEMRRTGVSATEFIRAARQQWVIDQLRGAVTD